MSRLLLAVLLLAACGDSSGPARIETAGSWSGPVQGNSGGSGTLTLTLTENAGTVTGNGTLTASSSSLALTVTGTYAPPTLSISLAAQGFQDLNLTATVGETSMAGTLNGSGFLNSAVTLTRQ